ncbi:NAD-dependent epimerase/dehydratase family protein [Sodalinema gerasimenkoae]|uniref:NAD-dependent epimerase/dehydratase family protein n=1 Tax=Sodalinema gerasimenkoae TaxID=2862348 RepID=UPI00135CA43D|nr:NAD-dependent epimerase/dehydratase family protein [Sodalinema gerasimenkoae]
MKTFVTGATGFTGSHLVRRLLAQGHTVKALVRPNSKNRTRLSGLDVEVVEGEITDLELICSHLTDVDWLFHTAAFVELGLVDDALMEQTNVDGTRTLLEAAKTATISKLIYCSTIGIYGDTQGQTIDETFQRTQKNFSSAYDRTKYTAQQLVNRAADQGLPVVSVMPSGIFGADDPHFGPVIENFLKGKLTVWAGGDRITGIVHVDDLVDGMIRAAEKSPPGEHYILSAGDLTTREMFAILGDAGGVAPPRELPQPVVRFSGNVLDTVGRLTGWNPPLSRERVHYIYERCVRVDGSKAQRVLGWQPRSVEQTLREIVAHKLNQTTATSSS